MNHSNKHLFIDIKKTRAQLVTILLAITFIVGSPLSFAEIVHKERSLYRNIIVEDSGDLRCLKFNEKSSKTNQSCLYKSNPEKLVFNYTKLLFSGLLTIDKPERILIVGLGGGTMSNTLHQLYPNAQIDNVEIDPAVIKVAREHFGFFENDHIKSYVKDGRIFVKRAKIKKQSYNWIILDAFNGDYIPEHLLTQEFLMEVKSLLAKNGVLTANTFSISELYAHESATYQAVFGHFYNVRNTRNSNRIILALANNELSIDDITRRAKTLKKPLKRFNIDIDAISDSMASTKNFQDWPKDTRVLTDQFSPANLLKNNE